MYRILYIPDSIYLKHFRNASKYLSVLHPEITARSEFSKFDPIIAQYSNKKDAQEALNYLISRLFGSSILFKELYPEEFEIVEFKDDEI